MGTVTMKEDEALKLCLKGVCSFKNFKWSKGTEQTTLNLKEDLDG